MMRKYNAKPQGFATFLSQISRYRVMMETIYLPTFRGVQLQFL